MLPCSIRHFLIAFGRQTDIHIGYLNVRKRQSANMT